MPNFSSLARLEVPEKFVWWWVGGVCTVIFVSDPTVVLCCVGVGVLTMSIHEHVIFRGLIVLLVAEIWCMTHPVTYVSVTKKYDP